MIETEYDQGDRLLSEALMIRRESRHVRDIIQMLICFVQLFIKQDKYQRTLIFLAGAVSSLFRELELIQPPLEQSAFEQDIQIAYNHLRKETAVSAWEQRGAMTIDEMVEFALMKNSDDNRL